MKSHRMVRVLKVLLFGAAALTIFGFVVMWLWNWLMPAVFGLHAVTFWQALGLLVLCKILFSSFLGRPHLRGDWRSRLISRWEDMRPEVRDKFRAWAREIERWEQMTPEEREKFRAEMRGGCGPFTPPESAPKA